MEYTICARIYQFRSIQDSDWFPLKNITCLVGKNGYGKTTILDALLAITDNQETEHVYHYADPRKPALAELAAPVIEPGSDKRLGVLRVQRLSTGACRYLFHAGESESELYKFCKAHADGAEQTGRWLELGLKNNGFFGALQLTLLKKGADARSNAFKGSVEELVSCLATEGLNDEDGNLLFPRGWALVPRIIRIPPDIACGDSASRTDLERAGQEVVEHLNEKETDSDPRKILRALAAGCLGWDASKEASTKKGMLEGMPISILGHLHTGRGQAKSISMNQIIETFWDRNFQLHVYEKENGREFEIKFQRGNGKQMRPSELSKGTKWFFGFLALAMSARSEAVRQAELWEKVLNAERTPSPREPESGSAEGVSSGDGNTLQTTPGIAAGLLKRFFGEEKTVGFRPPVLFLMDEPATFLHVESQALWLELMELVTRSENQSEALPPTLPWMAPWFCFATHAPNLVRQKNDLILSVDRVYDEEAIAYQRKHRKVRQTDSTIVRSPYPYESETDFYRKAVACFENGLNGPVHRVVLEGQSDSIWLNIAIRGVLSEGRPRYESMPMGGIINTDRLWAKLWDYLRDPYWVESTNTIVILFDSDAEGGTARSYLEKKWSEKKEDLGEKHYDYGLDKFKFSSMGEVTGMEDATSEDLVPWEILSEFCLNKLAKVKADALAYKEFENRISAKSAFQKLAKMIKEENIKVSDLKHEFLQFVRNKKPAECYKDRLFREKMAGKIHMLFT